MMIFYKDSMVNQADRGVLKAKELMRGGQDSNLSLHHWASCTKGTVPMSEGL